MAALNSSANIAALLLQRSRNSKQAKPCRPDVTEPTTTMNSIKISGDTVLHEKQKSMKKVRTGCITCKIRRVKCDEERPQCERCRSTGRKCDGYYIPPRKKRSQPVPTAMRRIEAVACASTIKWCLNVAKGTPEELHALAFFQQRTAPALSSYFDSGFWNSLVLRVGHYESSIKHAMITIASLHCRREGESPSFGPSFPVKSLYPLEKYNRVTSIQPERVGQISCFTLLQYNKAISNLSARLTARDQTSLEITLLACILFVCIEFLRGDSRPAINHYCNGMAIGIEMLTKRTNSTHLQTEAVTELILPFFHRLELLCMMFGTDGLWEYPVNLQAALPDRFHSVRDARDSVVHIMNHSLRFIRSCSERRHNNDFTPNDIAHQTSISTALRMWHEILDAFLTTKVLTARDIDAAKVLRIHQLLASVWVSMAMELTESAIDVQIPQFCTAVNLAESLLLSSTTTFLFDMEIVSPLYFIAIKCRHPILRRRAMAILRSTTRREGLWDSNVAAAVAERVIQIEESHLSVLDGSALPAEADRVYESDIDSTTSTDPTEHIVTFRMVADEYLTWQEIITVP